MLQKFHAAWVRQFEEKVLRAFELRLDARQGGVGLDQVGGGIDRAADFAVVAVLVFGVALGALAFDKAVGQKHVFRGVEKLLNGFALNQRAALLGRNVAQVAVDLARQFVVLRGVGTVPVVKADVKAVQVLLAPGGNVGHELLRRLARFFGGNHDGRPVGVVGAHKIDGMALHALKAHPDIGLDVLHDVADMEISVGVGQSGGDEKLAGHRWQGFQGEPAILGAAPWGRSQPKKR